MLKDNPDLLQLRMLQTMAAGDAANQTFVMGVGAGAAGLASDPAADATEKKS